MTPPFFCRARLLDGEFTEAISELKRLLWYVEDDRDKSYPLYVRMQAAISRGYLELGEVDEARKALPNWGADSYLVTRS